MSKFSGSTATTKKTAGKGPLKTKTSAAAVPTYNGGTGYKEGDKSALFSLAVANMVGETTFYESAGKRDDRFQELVHRVTAKDPVWMGHFIAWLRDSANMRSASVVAACEAAVAVSSLRAKGIDLDVSVRSMVSSACVRPDEPGEVLGYWLANYGRKIPMGVKRGIADAAGRLYNEKSALKYDTDSHNVRMGDVIELTHPKPAAEWQSALFGHLLDRRHGHVDGVPEILDTMVANAALKSIPEGQRREFLREHGPSVLAEAGITWEQLSGWIPGGMDAEAWASIIPSMGYMALLRNIRNFEQAGVSRDVLKTVRDRLADPDEIARSRQFPYRFWSAWKNSGSTFFASALEEGVEFSAKNIPALPGRTLVAVDVSGSMHAPVSGRSDIQRYEAGALFGAAIAVNSNCSLIFYADTWAEHKAGVSVLRTTEAAARTNVGGGTNTWPCVMDAWKKLGPFDRIMVFTDMQDHPATLFSYKQWGHYYHTRGLAASAPVLPDVPVYAWDLAGYGTANLDTNTPNRYLLGGFSDATFKMVPLLEAGRNAPWPWLQ